MATRWLIAVSATSAAYAAVRAKPRVGGGYFEKEVRALYGGKAVGVIVPIEVVHAAGLEVGMEVEVPFHEWQTVKGVPWVDVDEKPAKKTKKRVARAA